MTAAPHSNASAEQANQLMYLYECVTEHTHLERVIHMVATWVQGDAETVFNIPMLEKHSQIALKALQSEIAEKFSSDEGRTAQPYEDVLIFDQQSSESLTDRLEHHTEGKFLADAPPRIADWLAHDDEFLLERVTKEDAVSSLCLLQRVTLETGHDAVRLWRDDHSIPKAVEALLQRSFNVTHSEMLVLRHIATGGKVSDISAALGKSVETVRTQIKSLSNKLGVSGQARIASEIAKIEKTLLKSSAAQGKQDTASHSFRTSDDRSIHYDIYGPKDGQPIIFFHCSVHGRHLPQSINAQLDQANLRIISPSRAGYGGSTKRAAQARNSLTANSHDYAELIAHLGLNRCHLLAHATGVAQAFHFAVHYPEFSRKLVTIDAVPPVPEDHKDNFYRGLFRDLFVTMQTAPNTYKFLTKLVNLRLVSFLHPHKMIRRHIIYPDVDLEALETPEGLNAGTLNVRDLMENALEPSFEESLVYQADWAAESLGSNRVPAISLLHTRDNPFTTLEGSQGFAERLNARLHENVPTYPLIEAQLPLVISEILAS